MPNSPQKRFLIAVDLLEMLLRNLRQDMWLHGLLLHKDIYQKVLAVRLLGDQCLQRKQPQTQAL
jgi:hypothetical protein